MFEPSDKSDDLDESSKQEEGGHEEEGHKEEGEQREEEEGQKEEGEQLAEENQAADEPGGPQGDNDDAVSVDEEGEQPAADAPRFLRNGKQRETPAPKVSWTRSNYASIAKCFLLTCSESPKRESHQTCKCYLDA